MVSSHIAGGDGAADNSDLRALGRVQIELIEALIHLLVEKGVLTRNDALSVVQSVAEVQQGVLHEALVPQAATRTALAALSRLYASFEALADGRGAASVDGANIHHLRPPLHGDRPQFPKDD